MTNKLVIRHVKFDLGHMKLMKEEDVLGDAVEADTKYDEGDKYSTSDFRDEVWSEDEATDGAITC